jgi:peptide/nickel transport system substrate-binding protein
MTFAIGRRALALGAAALAAPAAPRAQPSQTLTIAIGGSITSVDPHFFNAAPNNMLKLHIFDCLTWRDERARVQPWLATGWRLLGDNLWEFKLRPNVTWHDGRPFTADDVVFTFQRSPNVPSSPGGFGSVTRTVTRTEILDPLTLRIHTSRPTPTLLSDLGSLAIVSRHAGEGASTEDYNAGRAAIGTGPYRLVSHRQGDRTELARNDAWWGAAPAWQRVSYRFIANDSARTAALLAGDVDVIDQIALTDVPRLRREARASVSEIASLRLVHIQPDFSRTGAVPGVTDNAGVPLAQNPFLDVRVRRALNIAINRAALVQAAMDGLAVAAGQWLPEGVWSHDPQTRPPAFDPDGARRLLAEAGFPQGFRLLLSTPNDRFPNDARLAQAVAQMWTRVGVATQVEALPWASYSARGARQEFGMSVNSWGSTTGEGLSFAVSVLQTFNPQARTGPANSRRFSNPEFDAMVDRAAATMDDAERERAIHGLVRWSAEHVPTFPLLHLTNFWGVRRGLAHAPRMDERTLAMGVRPAVA